MHFTSTRSILSEDRVDSAAHPHEAARTEDPATSDTRDDQCTSAGGPYLDNAWNQVFAYRQNGDFTIDNMAAERAIKPLANQRKNSLFYCSESGARNVAVFNTFIQTCKQSGISFMSYFRKVMNELKMAGQITKICFQPPFKYKFLVNESQNFRIANVATAVSRLIMAYTSRLDAHT